MIEEKIVRKTGGAKRKLSIENMVKICWNAKAIPEHIVARDSAMSAKVVDID